MGYRWVCAMALTHITIIPSCDPLQTGNKKQWRRIGTSIVFRTAPCAASCETCTSWTLL